MNGTLLDRADLPKGFAGVDELEAFMARPSRELFDDLATVSGDILVLGAGARWGRHSRSWLVMPPPPNAALARFSEKGLREILVTPRFRNRGIAMKLLRESVDDLEVRGYRALLDATPAGAVVYRRLGSFGTTRYVGV
jgi:GNAT superfamily N-acetyltransferase